MSVSPFAERHSAWWFYAGFNEMHNFGKGGDEIADEIEPTALDWIRRHAKRDNWFLQVNLWDPHTEYRTPMEYGNPFENDPPPAGLTEERIREHYASYGPHSAQDTWHLTAGTDDELKRFPRVPRNIASLADFKRWIDGYDVGIRYMDERIGRLFTTLDEAGVLDETAIILSADHGENQGELNIYGDHHTADRPTCNIPLIIRWPAMQQGAADHAFHHNADLAATVVDLVGGTIPPNWDGVSFAETLKSGAPQGREFVVVSQCAWACQRGVRFGPWLLLRTYDDGLKDLKPVMLFNLAEDPYETNDLAASRPEIVNEGLALLERWTAEMLATSETGEDSLWTVMHEGGPYHTRADPESYCAHLRATRRAHHAEALEKRHKKENR